jgi:signal transduction histidine kinase
MFGAVMFVASLFLARMMLAPVSVLTGAVRRLRDGDTTALNRQWPRELAPVAAELRALSEHIDNLIERSRNQTSDLAHALKTPLSILRQGAERKRKGASPEMLEQLNKIEQSVEWHLTRRRLSGPRRGRVQVATVAEGVIFAMHRLFAGRGLMLSASIPDSLHFQGDEEDLHEILGNLAENACKWARRRVLIAGSAEGRMLTLSVEDDGPGIPADLGEEIFRRGARLDEAVPGHGHGLAIVRDIVQAYGGEISAGTASIGGAAIRLSLPDAATMGA